MTGAEGRGVRCDCGGTERRSGAEDPECDWCTAGFVEGEGVVGSHDAAGDNGVSGQRSTVSSKWCATVSGSSSWDARWCKSSGGTARKGFGCSPALVDGRCGSGRAGFGTRGSERARFMAGGQGKMERWKMEKMSECEK